MNVIVDSAHALLTLRDFSAPCVLGRSGTCSAQAKVEGDGRTPLGSWPIRAVLFRPRRSAPPPGLQLPWRWTHLHDGWSDDPDDPAYNRPVRLPHGYGAEALQRDDMLYNVIVVLDHNLSPPVPGKGSAIFFHLWDEEKPPEQRSYRRLRCGFPRRDGGIAADAGARHGDADYIVIATVVPACAEITVSAQFMPPRCVLPFRRFRPARRAIPMPPRPVSSRAS